jgi:hypothetical protein
MAPNTSRGQKTCRLLYIKPEFCYATKCIDTIHTLTDMKKNYIFMGVLGKRNIKGRKRLSS